MKNILKAKENDIRYNLAKQLDCSQDQIDYALEKLNKCKNEKQANEFDTAAALIEAIGGNLDLQKKQILLVKTKGLIQKLRETDYKAIKFGEGEYSKEEYSAIKTKRQKWRQYIGSIEDQINACGSIEELEALEV